MGLAAGEEEAAVVGVRVAVLVVEDEAIVRMNTVLMLEDLGFEVLEAGDGCQALAVLEGRPDVSVLLTDCRIPRMSGPDLAEIATARWPHLRVVLVSGYFDGAAPKRWPLLGKPYQMSDLRRMLGTGGVAER